MALEYSIDDIHILKTSWIKIKIEESKLSETHYDRLFSKIPEIQELFKAPKLIQGRRIISSFTSIIDNYLNERDNVLSYVRSLGWRHKTYRIRKQHYPIFCQVLLDTFKEILGEEMDENIVVLWKNFLDDISLLMIDGAGYKK